MSEVPADDEHEDDDAIEGEVVPFPGVTVPAAVPVKPQRGQPGEWKPMVPEHLRTREGRRKAAGWHYRRARHHALYHGARSPLRLMATLGWAVVGLAQLGWWWVSEQTLLRHQAVAAGDTQKWLMLHKHAREVRLVRGLVLLAEATALSVGGVLLSSCSVLLWIPVSVVAVPVLAWIGRPDDKPIMTSAVVPVVIDRLTIELIVRTLGVLGIGEMNKAPGDLIERRAPVHLLGHCRPAPPWAFHRNRLLLVVA